MASLIDNGTLQIVASLFVAVLLCVLSIRLLRGGRKLPPGPPGLPIIGHLHLMGKNPHQIFHKLSQRYGPLISLRFGSVPVVVASSPETARQILQTHDVTFAGRHSTVVHIHLNRCHSILASQPGPYLNLARHLCITHLFNNKMLKIFSPLSTQEVGNLMRKVLADSRDGRPIPIRAHVLATLANVVSLMIFGDRRASELNLVDLAAQTAHLVASFNLSDFIPGLSWLDLQGHVKQSKLLSRKIKSIFHKIINERRQKHQQESYEPRDFLDTVLNTALDNKFNNVQLTDDDITAILMNLFAGGIETSSLVIEWALIQLLANPEKMTIVKDELHKNVGMLRLVQESDMPNLPYLQAMVKEILRLHPVGPLLVPHYSLQPCRMLDFEIPKHTITFVNVWAIGRDPALWENPLSFVPERFLDSKVDVRGRHFELLPFGCGRRACPGLSFGLNSVHLTLANLLHCFDWEKTGEVDLSENFDIVLQPATPLVASATPSLPAHVIEEQLEEI